MDPHRVLLYLMKQMEPLRCVPFVLIYGCATLGDERYPDTSFMQSIFDLYGCRYRTVTYLTYCTAPWILIHQSAVFTCPFATTTVHSLCADTTILC